MPAIHRARDAVLLLLALITAEPSQGQARSCVPTEGHVVVQLINEARAAHGLTPLNIDLRLATAARRHVEDLAAHDHVGHEGADGSQPALRATRAGYPWTFIAENVAAGYASAAEVVDGWMRSRSHRENILSERASHVGVGHVRRRGTSYDHFWAVSFGTAPDFTPPPANGCHP